MADITPIVSLNGEISPTASLTGDLAMPEKVWMQGPPGPQGPKGDTGAAATVTVGTVTTGEPGTDAILTNSGTENAAVLNFTIPKGETGAVGAVGPQGPKGDKGDTGPAGAGVPDGGTVGQLLGKTESGTAWIDPPQSGGGITTLHINVTGINAETMQAIFTADKTTTEMKQAAANGPIWCVVSFAAGLMGEKDISIGIPPVWVGYGTSFGGLTPPVHKENGNNDFICAVRGAPPDEWIIDLRAFGG